MEILMDELLTCMCLFSKYPGKFELQNSKEYTCIQCVIGSVTRGPYSRILYGFFLPR